MKTKGLKIIFFSLMKIRNFRYSLMKKQENLRDFLITQVKIKKKQKRINLKNISINYLPKI